MNPETTLAGRSIIALLLLGGPAAAAQLPTGPVWPPTCPGPAYLAQEVPECEMLPNCGKALAALTPHSSATDCYLKVGGCQGLL